jgi:hypothetical protein
MTTGEELDYYGRACGQGGRGRAGFQGRGRGQTYCYNCWKDDHINPDFPIKDGST